MANLLYVTCNLKPHSKSRTLSLGYEFLEEYLRQNPQDEVQVIDVFRDSIQRVDLDVLNALEMIERGDDYGHLSAEERIKMIRIWRLADQFGWCNKYVFVTHSLNLWFSAEFKTYIDAICVSDRTYRLTPDGAIGMLGHINRKSLHLHAGPQYKFGQEKDMSVSYLRSVLSFLGVAHQETILIDGDDPERVSKKEHEITRSRLLELAHSF